MTTNQKAAALISSLMRNLGISNHIVYLGKSSADDKSTAIFASVVLRELERVDADAEPVHVQQAEHKL